MYSGQREGSGVYTKVDDVKKWVQGYACREKADLEDAIDRVNQEEQQ